jgi:hypothetical protein
MTIYQTNYFLSACPDNTCDEVHGYSVGQIVCYFDNNISNLVFKECVDNTSNNAVWNILS